MARIADQKSSLLRSYGYTQGADGSLSVDPSNPYGKFQQMLSSQATASHHLEDLHRAGGFESGYGHAADDQLRLQQGGESFALGQGLTDALAGFKDQENTAGYDKDSALYTAAQTAAEQAIQDQAFNPANVGDAAAPTPTPTAAAPKKAKAAKNNTAALNQKVLKAAMAAKQRKGGR